MNDEQAVSWLRGSLIGDAGCLTLVQSTDLPSVLKAFGGVPAAGSHLQRIEGLQHSSLDAPLVALRRLDGWTLAIERNGWQGSRQEVLQPASAGSRAASVCWNADGLTQFAYAQDGTLTSRFDPVVRGHAGGANPTGLDAYLTDLHIGDDPLAALITLLGRVTHQIPTPQWLTGSFHIATLTPAADAVPVGVHADTQPLTYQDPVLAYHLWHADEPDLRAVARIAVEQALAATDLTGVAEVATALSTDPPTDSPALEHLTARALAAVPRARAARRADLNRRYQALDCLRAASSRDARTAGFLAYQAAHRALILPQPHTASPDPVERLRRDAIQALGDPSAPAGSQGLHTDPDAASVARYQWITRHWLRPASSLTVFHTEDLERIAAIAGGTRGTGIPCLSNRPLLALRSSRGWTVALGCPAGGLDYDALPDLSRSHGPVVMTAWRATGRAQLWYFDGGHLLAQLDPQRPEQVSGEQPTILDTLTNDLTMPLPGVPTAGHVPILLELIHRICGLDLQPEDLDHQHLLLT